MVAEEFIGQLACTGLFVTSLTSIFLSFSLALFIIVLSLRIPSKEVNTRIFACIDLRSLEAFLPLKPRAQGFGVVFFRCWSVVVASTSADGGAYQVR